MIMERPLKTDLAVWVGLKHDALSVADGGHNSSCMAIQGQVVFDVNKLLNLRTGVKNMLFKYLSKRPLKSGLGMAWFHSIEVVLVNRFFQ